MKMLRPAGRSSTYPTLSNLGRAGLVTVMAVTAALTCGGSDRAELRGGTQPAGAPGERSALSDLQPFLLGDKARVSAVVMSPSGRTMLQTRPRERHTLASVAKVYILVTFLDRVSDEGRPLSPEEEGLMEDMIESSDNDAASNLWRRAGGRDGVLTFLAEKGLHPIDVPRNDAWGDTRASAEDIAQLLLHLHQGRLLDADHTEIALSHMSRVIDSQSWGVGIAREEGSSGTTSVYFKNGWYPEDEGWIVNSAGIVENRFGPQIIVLLTDSQPTLEDGQRFLRGVMLLIEEHFGMMATSTPDAIERSVL
jgi:beta-lactamase class A